jgi:hypothetical protein
MVRVLTTAVEASAQDAFLNISSAYDLLSQINRFD